MSLPWTFDNRYVQTLPGDRSADLRSRQTPDVLWSLAPPTPVSAPRLLARSEAMANTLGLSPEDLSQPVLLQALSGNELLPGMIPYAMRYGGHQFGNWAGQLGDGRAINLGEISVQGQRWELQLKGAGPTAYSRGADGRAVLRSSLREFLCAEAMFHLGVPTTRSLSLVATGDEVLRDMLYDGNPAYEPGAIVCRVAPSFIRFGHFEILAARGEGTLLEQLVDFCIDRDYPELVEHMPAGEARRAAWFKAICERTAIMVAHWMRVGFVHGVMNTDNMSILGLTLDYGPYGWVDNFDPGWTPNTTDRAQRRYRFGRQPEMAYWNLGCLAAALETCFSDREALKAGLSHYAAVFADTQQTFTVAKFGFQALEAREAELMERAYRLMSQAEVDMTLFFRCLADLDPLQPQTATLQPAFYSESEYTQHHGAWLRWLNDYAAQLPQDPAALAQLRARMNAHNPIYVLRNYLAQEAIEAAEAGDLSPLKRLQRILQDPYTEQSGAADLAAKRPDWARQKPGCSMLSCSS